MWPFRKRNRKELVESERAILDATKQLHEVNSRENEIHQVSGALRTIRQRNHFAEQLRMIMERG
jgi:hypothetical protein